jgi:inosine-uridine nucleoside N-ribohydrolase
MSSQTTRPKIILDCDPGIDDALAIALAVAHCDVLALTTVGGNVGLVHTTRNAGCVLAMLGRSDIPVHEGAEDPLRGPIAQRAAEYHGLDGLGGVSVPEPGVAVASQDAVGAIIALVRANPGCWLVPTGPLTNIALVLRAAPDIAPLLAGISWMGGSTGSGNVTAAAEFNAWVDPEAVEEVLQFVSAHSVRFVMAGLNVTHSVTVDEAAIDGWRTSARGSLFADLLAPYLARYRTTYTIPGAAMHDAMAVVAVTHPELVTLVARHVSMDCSDGPNRGRTSVDDRPLLAAPTSNTEVMVSAEAAAVIALLAAAVAGDYS